MSPIGRSRRRLPRWGEERRARLTHGADAAPVARPCPTRSGLGDGAERVHRMGVSAGHRVLSRGVRGGRWAARRGGRVLQCPRDAGGARLGPRRRPPGLERTVRRPGRRVRDVACFEAHYFPRFGSGLTRRATPSTSDLRERQRHAWWRTTAPCPVTQGTPRELSSPGCWPPEAKLRSQPGHAGPTPMAMTAAVSPSRDPPRPGAAAAAWSGRFGHRLRTAGARTVRPRERREQVGTGSMSTVQRVGGWTECSHSLRRHRARILPGAHGGHPSAPDPASDAPCLPDETPVKPCRGRRRRVKGKSASASTSIPGGRVGERGRRGDERPEQRRRRRWRRGCRSSAPPASRPNAEPRSASGASAATAACSAVSTQPIPTPASDEARRASSTMLGAGRGEADVGEQEAARRRRPGRAAARGGRRARPAGMLASVAARL